MFGIGISCCRFENDFIFIFGEDKTYNNFGED